MEKRENLTGLDVLKIAASTLIIYHHYQQVFHVSFRPVNFYRGAFNFGYLVELFFIISGFLTLYSDKAEKPFVNAFRKKIFRFLPVVTIACTFTLLVKSIASADLSALWNWKSLIANYFLIFSGWPFFSMIGYNNPTWYLCVLIQCYLVFYLVRWLSRTLGVNRLWLDAVIVAACFVLRRLGYLPDSTYRGLQAFSVGILVCGLRDVFPKKNWIYCLLLPLSVVLLFTLPTSYQRRIVTFLTYPALLMLFLGLWGSVSDTVSDRIRLGGKLSFEVYVWHYPLMAFEQMVLRLTDGSLTRTYLTMVLFSAAVWILAILLYRFVETPIDRKIREGSCL